MTPLQRRFVDEYLKRPNATSAYKAAGYKAAGHAAEANACRLLRNAEVAAAILAGQTERAAAAEIDQEYVLRRLKMEAEDAGEDSSHAARVAALKLLGQHLGMFVQRIKLEGGAVLQIVEEIVDAGSPPNPDPNGATALGAAGVSPV